MTQEKFIEKVNSIYGDKYDYSKVIYKGVKNEVILIDRYTKQEIVVKPIKILYKKKYNYVSKRKEERANVFIRKSKEKFGDKFDYSKVEYIDSRTPVTLICKEHGEFSVNMYTHLYSKDGLCPLCTGWDIEFRRGGIRRLSTEYIIEKCKHVYGDKYDYSKIEYKGGNARTEMVEIVCPVHGSFFKNYDSIQKRDCGCPKCARDGHQEEEKLNNANRFIERSREKFGDRFDYSELEYIDSQTPVTLICKEHNIRFSTRPTNHFTSRFGGCNECYKQYLENLKVLSASNRIKLVRPKLSEEEKKERRKNRFIKKATEKFGDRFDYSMVEYIGPYIPVKIIDKENGNEVFSTKPSNFLSSVHGRLDTLDIKKNKFIERARKLHGDKYDYSKVEYNGDKEKVCIICPIHGEFWQTPHNHLNTNRNGCGCPKCANMVSKLEENVINRLNEENISFKKEYVNKEIFGNMRGDFFIKSYNVMIECQGSQHFEENNPLQRSYGGNLSGQIERDYNFNKCCKDAKIKLLYYFNKDNAKGIDYLNDKKFNGIYTEKNTFTDIDSLVSCIKNKIQ